MGHWEDLHRELDAWLEPYRREWSNRLDALERHLQRTSQPFDPSAVDPQKADPRSADPEDADPQHSIHRGRTSHE